MSEQPSFPIAETAPADRTTGRYIITFREDAVTEGLALLSDQAGITGLANAADFSDSALECSEIEATGGAVFPTLGVAVVSLEEGGVSSIRTSVGENSAVLAIEPERIFYAIEEGLSPEYLRGYRDAVDNLYQKATTEDIETIQKECFADDTQFTWGLKATKVDKSLLTGSGIKVAVLDTGMDLLHPDFAGRSIVSQSFVPGESVQDTNSHGTHCIGTACGFQDLNGRRYGVAYESTIYVGKVLSNAGSGDSGWILAGMEWAIANGCQVISMSLGNTTRTPSTAYETVGRRALQNGCLIVAAAGNNGRTGGTVGQPANICQSQIAHTFRRHVKPARQNFDTFTHRLSEQFSVKAIGTIPGSKISTIPAIDKIQHYSPRTQPHHFHQFSQMFLSPLRHCIGK
jgi:subtilisin